MSLHQYLDAMERNGINRDVVLATLYRHAQYVEEHGLTAGIHDEQTSTDHWEAMKYGRAVRHMIDEEVCARKICEMADITLGADCMGKED